MAESVKIPKSIRIAVLGLDLRKRRALVQKFAAATIPGITQKETDGVVVNVADIGTYASVMVSVTDAAQAQARIHMVLFNVRNAKSVTSAETIVSASVKQGKSVVLVGVDFDDTDPLPQNWADTVQAARDVDTSIPVFLTSAKTDFNVQAAFRSAVVRFWEGPVRMAYENQMLRWTIAPRAATQRTVALQTRIATMFHVTKTSEHVNRPRPIFVMLTNEEVRDFASKRVDLLLPEWTEDETLIWLPGTRDDYASEDPIFGEILDDKSASGRLRFQQGERTDARTWLSTPPIAAGWIKPFEPRTSWNTDDISDRLSKIQSLDDHAGPRVVRWNMRDALLRDTEYDALVATMKMRQLCKANVRPWAYYHEALVLSRQLLLSADFTGVPMQETPDVYDLARPAKLGEGAFGCVLRTSSNEALKVTFFRDFGGPQAQDKRRMELNEARQEIAFPQYLAKACRFATPYIPEGVSGYIAEKFSDDGIDAKTLRREAMRRASDQTYKFTLPEAIVYYCSNKVDTNPSLFDMGAAITVQPIYDVGEFGSSTPVSDSDPTPIINKTLLPSLAFQLFQQLFSWNTVCGFVHMDIKPANILVRSRRPDESSKHVIRMRIPSAEEPSVSTEVLFVDDSPYIALLSDYGLSTMNNVPHFSAEKIYRNYSPLSVYRTGTYGYIDPTLAMFYDPKQPSAKSLLAHPRGIAGDIWALGMSILAVYSNLSFVNDAKASDLYIPEYPTALLAAEPPSFTRLADAMRTQAVALPRGQQAASTMQSRIDTIFGTARVGGRIDYYARVFLNSLLIHKAFVGDWPAETLGTGPFWNYVMKAEFKEALEQASSSWNSKEPGTVYDYMVRKLDDKNLVNFLARCFTFDDFERAKFLTSGELFEHPFIQQGIKSPSRRTVRQESVFCNHALDLFDLPAYTEGV